MFMLRVAVGSALFLIVLAVAPVSNRVPCPAAGEVAPGREVAEETEASSPAGPGVVDATRFGVKGDGRTDDTAALQSALDAAAARGGGEVHLPAGQYRLDGTLTIPPGATLSGVWRTPHFSTPGVGTTLLAFAGKGKEDGPPLIAMKTNTAVRGLTVFYPEQTASDVKPYPWTIQGAGTHCSVSEVTLLNPYRGIDFGTHANELHYIRNVYGCPLRTGVYLDRCTDIGRVENVHFNPNSWTRSGVPGAPRGADQRRLVEFMQKNLVAFEIGRSDWEFMVNTFSWGARIGYRFFRSRAGCANGNFLGIAADWAVIPLLVEDAQAPGLLITNGEFVGSTGAPAVVKIAPSNNGAVQLANCSFWGPHEKIALAEGRGTLSLSQCNFVQWDHSKGGVAAIDVLAGSLILQGSIFHQDKPQVHIGPDVRSAVILGNQVRGKIRVENESRGQVEILGNVSLER